MDDNPRAGAAPDAAELLLPVGLLLGTSADGAQRVRRGVDIHELTAEEYGVWVAAHGSAAAILGQQSWGRAGVLDLAVAADITEPSETLERLLTAGLVVELAADGAEAEPFARTHRLTPLMLGLGNTAADPDLFGIGVGGAALVQVGFAEYDLWQFSAIEDTLWDACRGSAATATTSPTTPSPTTPSPTTPSPTGPLSAGVQAYPDEELVRLYLHRFLEALPGLLLTGAAHLDVSFRLARPARDARDGVEAA